MSTGHAYQTQSGTCFWTFCSYPFSKVIVSRHFLVSFVPFVLYFMSSIPMGIGMVSHQRCMSHVGARPTTLLRAIWEQAALCVLTFDAPAFQWYFCKGGPSDQWSMEDCAVAQTNILYCSDKACQLSLIPASRIDLHDFN